MYLVFVLGYQTVIIGLVCASLVGYYPMLPTEACSALSGVGLSCFIFWLFRDPFPKPKGPFRSIREILGETLCEASGRGVRKYTYSVRRQWIEALQRCLDAELVGIPQ